ncbi:MAG: hypothetical protein WC523_00015 [Patescibacteria group bacterium]
MENLPRLLEAIKQQKIAVVDAERIAAHAHEQVQAEKRRLAELEAQSADAYQGRSRYTEGQRVEVRRGIRVCLCEPKNIGEICESLADYDRALVEHEVDYLCTRKVLVWNGSRGPASKYSRV